MALASRTVQRATSASVMGVSLDKTAKLMSMSVSSTSVKTMPHALMHVTLTLRSPPAPSLTSVSVPMAFVGNTAKKTLTIVRALVVRPAVSALMELAHFPASVLQDSSKRVTSPTIMCHMKCSPRGRLCEEEIDECLSAPCHPAATCVDGPSKPSDCAT